LQSSNVEYLKYGVYLLKNYLLADDDKIEKSLVLSTEISELLSNILENTSDDTIIVI
jgi:hypothetical protein